MREISNLELHILAKELQPLVGARLQKFYELGDGDFRMEFFVPGKGTQDVAIVLKQRIGFTKYVRPAPKEPTRFAMQVRKHLEGAVVRKFEQYGMDRVLFFDFGKDEKQLRLVIEMFSDGNLILTDIGGKIIVPYRPEEWKDRTLKRGANYIFPASTKVNPFDLSEEKLRDVMNEKKLIACLAGRVDLGAQYLEEVLHRAKLPFDRRADSLNEDELEKLMEAFVEVVQQLNRPQPTIYYKEGKPSDFSPFPLEKYAGQEAKPSKSMSEMLDELYAGAPSPQKPEESKREEEKKKMEFTLKAQKEAVVDLRRRAEEAKLAGDLIYEKYQGVEELLELIRSRRKAGATWEEIEKELEGKAKVDRVRGKLEAEL